MSEETLDNSALQYSPMSPASRFVNIFVSPRETFASLTRSKWAWVLPVVIAFGLGMASYTALKPIYVEEQMSRIERAPWFESMPESQREEIMTRTRESMENPPWWQWLMGPVVAFGGALIVSAILLLIGNIILGGEATYVGMLHVFAFASLVAVPETVVKGILISMKQTLDVRTSLALLMPSADTSSFLYGLLNKMDIFSFWLLGLVIIGMSVFLPRVSQNKIAVWVIVFWLVWVLISAGLSTLTGGLFGF
jgi:hypothetical protein